MCDRLNVYAMEAVGRAGAEDLFGQVLSRHVALSRHDIYEILEEQSATKRKFGQIALAWGLCQPEQIWQAWATQLVGRTPRIDLDQAGIDAQAAADLPAWAAVALGVVPIRATADRLIVAASEKSLPRATELLTPHARKPVQFVVANEDQVERAVARYYAEATGGTKLRVLATTPCPERRCGSACKGDACPIRQRTKQMELA